jgi:hypothetical protein
MISFENHCGARGQGANTPLSAEGMDNWLFGLPAEKFDYWVLPMP